MYLREMGTVPLLTREGEVAIAKRIERGQLLVLKTITRSPIILKELLTIGEASPAGALARSRKLFSSTTKSSPKRRLKIRPRKPSRFWIGLAKLYLECLKEAAKLERMVKSKKRPYLRAKYHVARLRIEMSQLARSIEFPSLRAGSA